MARSGADDASTTGADNSLVLRRRPVSIVDEARERAAPYKPVCKCFVIDNYQLLQCSIP